MSIKGAPLQMKIFLHAINTLNEWVGRAVSWLFLALIASVCIDLFTRFFTGKSTDWAFDINYMIYGTNFMLAGAYALKHNSHHDVIEFYAQIYTWVTIAIPVWVQSLLPTPAMHKCFSHLIQ